MGLQFSHRPTAPILLVGGALVLLGLVPALYAFRRRLWVEASVEDSTPTQDGATLVTIAGRAFQRPQAFDAEFPDLVDKLAAALEATQQTKRTPT